MYGRGKNSIAEQLGCSPEEAEDIKNNVYDSFPKIKQFERDSAMMVREKGYVTTLWGRRRHLPDYNLPNYEVYYADADGNPRSDLQVPQSEVDKYIRKLSHLFWKQRDDFIEECKNKDGIIIIDNGKKIAAAARQIINSRVQGSAADMSKLALIKIRNDEELIKRDVKAIIPVHDEILIETPLRYAKYVKKRFAQDMETAARPVLTIPITCDVVSSERWYGDELNLDEVLKDFDE